MLGALRRRSRRTAARPRGGAAQAAHDDRLVHERPAARAGAADPDLGARHAGGFPGRGRRLLRRAAGPRRGAVAGSGFCRLHDDPGIRRAPFEVRSLSMRVRIAIPALAALVGLLGARPAVCQAPPAAEQHETDLSTSSGKFPLYVTAEYLGMAGLKTVMRVRLRAPELSMAAGRRGLTSFSGELQGSFLEGLRRRAVLQVPGLGRDRHADDVHVRLPALDRARRLHAQADAARPRRRARSDEASTELSVPEVGAKFSAGHGARPRPRRCRRPRPS